MDVPQKCHHSDLTFLQNITKPKVLEITDKIVLQQYNEYCRLHNIRIFGKNEHHTCSNSCQFWEYKNKTKFYELVFVCKYSRLIHRCGKNCSKRTLTKNREGYICSLTAYEVDRGPELSYISQSKDTFSSVKTLGNNFIRMGKQPKKRTQSTHKTCPHIKIIEQTVISIMTGEQRLQQYKTNLSRFLKEISHIKQNTIPEGTSFMHTNFQIVKILNNFKQTLKKPAHKNDQRISILSKAIIKFWEKFSTLLHFSVKTIATFTAVCISKLRKGYTIGNIIIFPYINWVETHAPTDIQFGGIHNIQCRNMSILWRKLQEKILSPNSNLPIRTMVFDPITTISQ